MKCGNEVKRSDEKTKSNGGTIFYHQDVRLPDNQDFFSSLANAMGARITEQYYPTAGKC